MPETGVIDWPIGLFKSGDALDQPCPPQIDVTGKVRALVFGPMVVLPAGRWRLDVHFALSEQASKVPYMLHFIRGDVLTERMVQPSGPGRFTLSLEADHPQDAMAALRLWNARAAFHGTLYFLGASVRPV